MTVDAYPLTWPAGWERTTRRVQNDPCRLTFGIVRDRVLHELRLLGATHVVISSNIPVRLDGLPYSKFAEPADPGVAVYFTRKGKQLVMAREKYRRTLANLWSIGHAVEHLRGLERHGGGALLERAFTGFLALPEPSATPPWWEVLRILRHERMDLVEARYRELAKLAHTDRGGSHERMVELNRAIAEARAAAAANGSEAQP